MKKIKVLLVGGLLILSFIPARADDYWKAKLAKQVEETNKAEAKRRAESDCCFQCSAKYGLFTKGEKRCQNNCKGLNSFTKFDDDICLMNCDSRFRNRWSSDPESYPRCREECGRTKKYCEDKCERDYGRPPWCYPCSSQEIEQRKREYQKKHSDCCAICGKEFKDGEDRCRLYYPNYATTDKQDHKKCRATCQDDKAPIHFNGY